MKKEKTRLTIKQIMKVFKIDPTFFKLEILMDEDCSILYEVKEDLK